MKIVILKSINPILKLKPWIATLLIVGLQIPCQSNQISDIKDYIKIGWASTDITPDQPVLIAGQFYARVSEGIMDPVTVTAMAIESGEGPSSEKAILISCDLVTISDGTRYHSENSLLSTVRKKLIQKIRGVKPEQILMNATHTHSAPYCSPHENSAEIYGIGLDVMPPSEYLKFISEKIVNAAEKAWGNRKPGGLSYAYRHAVTGHNRLQSDFNGKSKMSGNTNRKDFSHIEGYEDHSVNLMYTWDVNKNLTGIVVNVASPSQVSRKEFLISADYWHDTRVELHKRLGEDIFILPQCSAAGDQMPHALIGEKAEARMQRIKFGDTIKTGNVSKGLRRQIALQLADAITPIIPLMKENIDFTPVFRHNMEIVELSRRLIGLEDVESAQENAEVHKSNFDRMLLEIENNPDVMKKSRWYTDITRTYSQAKRGDSVKERYELEKVQPFLPVELHVLRFGDVVFATNPFELYVDYGMRIKARSSAIQTFIVQLTGSGSYVPTTRSIAGGAYGAVPASTLIGPEGGQELVERTLTLIDKIME